MESTQQVHDIVEDIFKGGVLADCFVVEIVKNGRSVKVFFDSDSGVTLEKCTLLSRQLEKRMEEAGLFGGDYVLEVSSPGVERPLKLWRQYPRQKGRTLEVTRIDGTAITGKLSDVGMDTILLEVAKDRTEEIPFTEIEKSIVQISF